MLTLGIDIGTFESKGVLVDADGTVHAKARCPHRMQVPRPGWAEHDAMADWWGDFVRLTRALLAHPGIHPDRIAAEAAATPKGARGLMCLPYFSGERTPIHDPQAKGAFFGLNLTHGRAEMFRAVCEGIAAGTAHVFETMAEAGAAPARVLAVGGGTQNAVWMQATSDMGGTAQLVCQRSTGASYGNAFLAALATGRTTPDAITRWNPVARTVATVPDAAYARQYPLWKRRYAQTRDIAHALGEGA